MLISIKFSNFKSFKNEIQLNMKAQKNKENIDLLIDLGKEGKYLKTASVFGGNSSGKSNLLEIFSFLQFNVLYRGTKKDENDYLKYTPYYYSQDMKKKPIDIEVEYIYKQKIYNYFISVNCEKINQEILRYKDTIRNEYKVIFERTNEKVSLNDKVFDKDYNLIFNNISIEDKKSFFSTLSGMQFFNSDVTKNAYEWIKNIKYYDFGYDRRELSLLAESLTYHNDNESINKILSKCAEFLRKCSVDVDEIFFLAKEKEHAPLPYVRKSDKEGNKYETPLLLESTGTIKLFIIYMMLINKFDQTSLFVIDELDSKLHPFLTKKIVELFYDKNVNKDNVQLIYTSHSISLLLEERIRRDALIFVDKIEGVSSVISANDYTNLRQKNSILKKYYEGEIGGQIEKELLNWKM